MRMTGAFAILTLWLWAGAAMAAERIALVMGIADYQSIGPLKNTINDARRISQTLEQIGFEVTTAYDTTSQQMHDLLKEFAFRSETADLALIYFAGHGVEVQGENFLIPADAQVASNADIQRQAVSLKDMLVAVDRARKMRIVILDSCRNNPFGDLIDTRETAAEGSADGTRGGGGLAQPTPDRGTLVSFAAKDGNVALDGSGTNSPFAIALSDRLKQPNLEISLMFRQVRDQVLQSTANQQEPHTYGALSGVPFYLAGTDGTEAAVDDRRIAWSDLRPEQEAQLTRLADGGDTRSMLGLGYMRLNPDTERFDPAAAADLFTRAADAGAPEAQFELAKLYEQGLGVAPDPARALSLYQASAAQDFADAINDLGFFYYQGGLGLPRDPQKALALFERAADLRHPQAMFNFAALIDDGLIAGKGPEASAAYLYDALRSGSDDVLKIMTEQPQMFSIDTRKALQRKLQEVAFYDGVIDGDFGPGTQRGIRRAYGLGD
ncbi:caspase family protein [Actibacterium ureilyticum]|uniref:caspase family protein n=1 Tax=Actibacterium ureilyticum TaxID=1590614 RepID=UPI000BAAFDB6|nr:caspase family protein [Actibacterium ureilyticum]